MEAAPYGWPDSTTIPRRQWLYYKHFIRGYVSATIAAGGVGKSSLTIAETVAMICGRALLHDIKPVAALNVWIWNGEDPLDELHRRIAATLKHYGIRRDDCRGKLFVNSGRDTQVVVAEMIRGEIKVQRPLVEAVKATIVANQIDVMIVDPFVSSHRVNENDNAAIDVVSREWAGVANATGCSIDLVHHARKVGDVEVTVEAARGASAMISAARSARALNQMTAEEAKKAGVENRRTYFRVTTGKANMSPAPEASQWFEMKSVDLENGDHFTPSDFIGVVTDWKWPDPLDDVTVADLEAVKNIVASGQWRESVQAKEWVGKAIAKVLGLDTDAPRDKEKIKGLLRIWIKNGVFHVVRRPDGNGDERPFVEVNPDTP
ncbi:MAG: AAA family ATPase [Rhizobiales bacterium]|nr:AAA family ATPase [Hyphomicrobiales bacterium]